MMEDRMSKYIVSLKKILTEKKNLYILLVIGILILFTSNIFSDKDKPDIKNINDYSDINILCDEERLEKILSKVKGAGKTSVMITYETRGEKITVQNSKTNKSTTENLQQSGGGQEKTEITEEKEIVMNGSGSSQTPFVTKEINPTVRGVLVVSEGADDEIVSYNLKNAVAAVLDVPYHRIEVLKKSK